MSVITSTVEREWSCLLRTDLFLETNNGSLFDFS